MSKPYQRVIWWIKRDLRLHDNAALTWAIANGSEVLPLYIIEPLVTEHPDWSGFHGQAVAEGLSALRSSLQETGAELVVLQGEAPQVFLHLLRSPGYDALVSYQETGPLHTFGRDQEIRQLCGKHGVHLEEPPTNGVIRGLHSREVRMKEWRRRMEIDPLPAPTVIPQSRATLASFGSTPEHIVTLFDVRAGECRGTIVQPVSEEAGLELLSSFLNDRARSYKADISAVERAAHSCSRLSIHLAWGTVSIRQVVHALERRREQLETTEPSYARQFRANLSAFRSRIFWHDHFIQRLEDEPEMEHTPLNRAFLDLPYITDGSTQNERLGAWLAGTTGFPMVDACMRSFAQTGWLNFRMRAMVVSFACHVLHLDWRSILWPMARLMADYIPGIHLSQTQMQAGVIGINTFRIYKPAKQLTDHDPECTFVKSWIPELRDASPEQITVHEQTPVSGYRPPIVDYATESKAMRSALWAIKKSPAGRAESARVLEKHGSRLRGRRS